MLAIKFEYTTTKKKYKISSKFTISNERNEILI